MFKVMIQPKNTVTQWLITSFCLDHTFPLHKPIWGRGVCGGGEEEGAEESGFCSPCRIFLSDTHLGEQKERTRFVLLRKQLWGQFVKLAVIASTWSLLDWRKTRAEGRAMPVCQVALKGILSRK